MPKSQRATPADLSPSWPDSPSAEPDGEVARLLALRLDAAIPYRSVRKVADIAGVDEGTIRNIVSGSRWPDLRTIVRLEEALGVALWPSRSDDGARL
ncbi:MULTISPECIES: helix-turn-helix domain-containing protein [unclassified Microbacterium]|uniref:helix-turn-helix domain-containing protein n=1 Tax=unclassified Microbacterium TaxID=2609290 RepID=UPI0037C55EF7